MYKPSTLPNTRIDVADILRGIAIGGIVLIHFIEQLNFYNFPEPSSPFWAALAPYRDKMQNILFCTGYY